MRKFIASQLVWLASFGVMPCIAPADDEFIVEEARSGIPVQTAIFTRRYSAVETEDEVAGQEFEAGIGATNTFKFVHWRRWARPYGWYGSYGPGPGYYVGYRPRYYGYYAPYWGGYYGAPYVSYYAPPALHYGGYGGCYYW